MEVLTAAQIREWDRFTIEQEPVSSIDLMERAALKCSDWLAAAFDETRSFRIFCGKGNNGGDGLAIARQLLSRGRSVSVHILEFGKIGTEDFQLNLQRLHAVTASISFIQSPEQFPLINTDEIVVDALFGTGLNKPAEGLSASLIQHINHAAAEVVSIDIPSGMFSDSSSAASTVVKADTTLSFQCWKPAFIAAENAAFTGKLIVLDIGLSRDYLSQVPDLSRLLDHDQVKKIYRPRLQHSHKGDYGHALLAGGSFGKMGALLLAARACLHSGAGLTTCFIPGCGYQIIQTAVPEAMVITGDHEQEISGLPEDIHKYSCIGIGPGMGTGQRAATTLSFCLRRFAGPMVIDADALNIIAENPAMFEILPEGAVLTPHPKEFDRLFGSHANAFERWDKAVSKAVEHQVVIILKGHHSLVALPDGKKIFNTTGNAGLAKGGSGDVLTGIITALLAQGYPSEAAACMGVFLHGMAGDLAADALSQEYISAGNIINYLGAAFRKLQA